MVKFAIELKIGKNNVVKAVVNRRSRNNFFYFSFLSKKIGLHKEKLLNTTFYIILLVKNLILKK